MIRRRQVQVFSLSFLDCICCGFGAIILIWVLSLLPASAGTNRYGPNPRLDPVELAV